MLVLGFNFGDIQKNVTVDQMFMSSYLCAEDIRIDTRTNDVFSFSGGIVGIPRRTDSWVNWFIFLIGGLLGLLILLPVVFIIFTTMYCIQRKGRGRGEIKEVF